MILFLLLHRQNRALAVLLIIGINMVDVSEELTAIEESMQAEDLPADEGKVTEDHSSDDVLVTEDQFAEKMEVAYPKVEEELIDFFNRCKISNTNVMLIPRCSAVFDKEAAKSVEGFRPQPKKKGRWTYGRPKFGFNKRGMPYKMKPVERNSHWNHKKTFNPPAKSPTDTWVFSCGRKYGFSAPTTKWVKRVATTPN